MNLRKSLVFWLCMFAVSAYSQQEYRKSNSEFKTLLGTFDSIKKISVLSYISLGRVYENLSETDSAAIYYKKSNALAKHIKHDSLFGMSVSTMSSYYITQGKFEELTDLLLEAISKNKAHIELTHKLYYQLAEVNRNLGYIDKAKLYLNKIIENSKDYNALGGAYYSIGAIYLQENNKEQGIQSLKKCLDYQRKLNDTHNTVASLLTLGALHYPEYLDTAEAYFLEAKQISEKGNYENLLSYSLTNLASISYDKNNTVQQLEYLLKAKSITKKTNNQKLLSNIYQSLIKAYAKSNDHENHESYLSLYTNTLDSLYNIEKNEKVLEIQSKFDIEQKELELNHQKALVQKQENNNKLIFLGLVLLVALLLISFLFYRHKIKAQSIVIDKQEELNNEKIKNIIDNHNLENAINFVNGQVQERERISKDLHDNVSGNLASLKLQIANIGLNDKVYTKISKQLDTIYKQTRDLSYKLVSKRFQEETFLYLIQEYIENLNTSKKIEFIFSFKNKTRLNCLKKEIQIEIFRIIQELITNTIKHSRANKVNVILDIINDNIELIVEDNGIGFNTQKKSGMGIKNIHDRIYKLKGKTNIDSFTNKGTVASISIPITS